MGPTNDQLVILLALNHRGGIYQGTANPLAVARRRAKNKLARKSRRINRKGN